MDSPRSSLPGLLVDSSEHLRDARRRLTLVQSGVNRLPVISPLPCKDTHLRFGSFTKAKRSHIPPVSIDRFSSEVYPLAAPPRHDFFPGVNSRHIGRSYCPGPTTDSRDWAALATPAGRPRRRQDEDHSAEPMCWDGVRGGKPVRQCWTHDGGLQEQPY